MQLISITTVLLGLLSASSIAAPTKRAAARSFAELTISSGTGGNAKAEALAKLPVDVSNLAGVSAADLDTLQTERETAEDAETDGFNGAISSASGAAADALSVGKIKNKVLKLTFEVTALQVQQAQGADNQDKIDEEQTKLNNNIALDVKNNGKASQTVDFTGN